MININMTNHLLEMKLYAEVVKDAFGDVVLSDSVKKFDNESLLHITKTMENILRSDGLSENDAKFMTPSVHSLKTFPIAQVLAHAIYAMDDVNLQFIDLCWDEDEIEDGTCSFEDTEKIKEANVPVRNYFIPIVINPMIPTMQWMYSYATGKYRASTGHFDAIIRDFAELSPRFTVIDDQCISMLFKNNLEAQSEKWILDEAFHFFEPIVTQLMPGVRMISICATCGNDEENEYNAKNSFVLRYVLFDPETMEDPDVKTIGEYYKDLWYRFSHEIIEAKMHSQELLNTMADLFVESIRYNGFEGLLVIGSSLAQITHLADKTENPVTGKVSELTDPKSLMDYCIEEHIDEILDMDELIARIDGEDPDYEMFYLDELDDESDEDDEDDTDLDDENDDEE